MEKIRLASQGSVKIKLNNIFGETVVEFHTEVINWPHMGSIVGFECGLWMEYLHLYVPFYRKVMKANQKILAPPIEKAQST